MIIKVRFFFTCIMICASIGIMAQKNTGKPNIILIFCDDLGYGDLSCYGSLWNQTPELDQMAVEGLRFTDFYAGAPVCSPSRAGLMTGSYARRVDLDLDHNKTWVLFPRGKKGINPEETTLPEVLKEAGYATAIIGKWHLGDQPEFFPVRHGFDYWYGLPYSNDMGIKKGDARLLPIMRNETIAYEFDQRDNSEMALVTKRYTEEAIQWIDRNKEQPFFLYMSHTMPHNPVAARDQFLQKTNNPKVGFGGSIAEISWSTGEILNYIKKKGIEENTLVIFTSDNGGAPNWGANNGILKGRKGQTYEGGVRVPCIAWWPGKIDPGTTCYAPASILDFYPTFATLANHKVNDRVKRDGIDITDYFFNPETEREARPYYYWHSGYLHGVRYGNWKLNMVGLLSEAENRDFLKRIHQLDEFSGQVELYDLHSDPGEQNNVAEEHPDVVDKLMGLAENEKKALGEYTNLGPEVRQTLWIDSPELIIK